MPSTFPVPDRQPPDLASIPKWLALVLAILTVGTAWAQRTERLDDCEPFDRITLTPDQGSVSLDIFPLATEGESLPPNPNPRSRLTFRLMDQPDKTFQVEYRYVAKVETFNEIRLAEVQQRLNRGQFEDAYRLLRRIQADAPQWPALGAALNDFLLRNAAQQFRRGELRGALSQLDELAKRDPRRPELKNALEAVAEKMFASLLARQDYRAARTLISWFRDRYPDAGLPAIAQRWQGLLNEAGERHLSQAQQQVRAGNWLQARRVGMLARDALPDDARVRTLWRELAHRYPVLAVGVLQASPSPHDAWPLESASRRQQRLLVRTFVEQVGIDGDGGIYHAPFGQYDTLSGGKSLRLSIAPPLQGNDSLHPARIAQWFAVVQRGTSVRRGLPIDHITVTGPDSILFEFDTTVFKPEGLFTQSPTPPSGLPDYLKGTEQALSPYRRVESHDRAEMDSGTRFVIHDEYALATATQPREIHERVFADSTLLRDAVRAGAVQVAVGIHPADWPSCAQDPDLTVVPLGAPSLHFLVPNVQREIPGSRTARRGLLYALDRAAILHREILAGTEQPGAAVLNGPFPVGTSLDDPLAYAVDPQARARGYNPYLALTLYRLAQNETRRRALERAKEPDKTPVPPANASGPAPAPAESPDRSTLRLVYPATQRARITAAAIARAWQVLDIPVEPKELADGRILPDNGNWDFLLVDLVMTEPLHDIHFLLGDGGLVSDLSPYLRLALARVRNSTNWEEARQALRQVHQLTQDELPVLPLWQLPEVLVARRSVTGVADQPMTAFQDIEKWRIDDEGAVP